MMDALTISLPDQEATRSLARCLARLLPEIGPQVLLLQGDLGAGKTTLARYLVEALPGGAQAEVSSPSFTLCNAYATTPPVLHFDLYRLENARYSDDLLEALEQAEEGGCLLLIEWPERLENQLLPQNFMRCILTEDENSRTALVYCQGTAAKAAMQKLAAEAQRCELKRVA